MRQRARLLLVGRTACMHHNSPKHVVQPLLSIANCRCQRIRLDAASHATGVHHCHLWSLGHTVACIAVLGLLALISQG